MLTRWEHVTQEQLEDLQAWLEDKLEEQDAKFEGQEEILQRILRQNRWLKERVVALICQLHREETASRQLEANLWKLDEELFAIKRYLNAVHSNLTNEHTRSAQVTEEEVNDLCEKFQYIEITHRMDRVGEELPRAHIDTEDEKTQKEEN